MKPTGKTAVFRGVNMDRVVDGRIVEHGGAANTLRSALEIGAIRPVKDGEERSFRTRPSIDFVAPLRGRSALFIGTFMGVFFLKRVFD